MVVMRRFLLLVALLPACTTDEPEASKYKKRRALTGSANVQQDVTVGWNEPLDSRMFGMTANPNFDGKTLAQIIASIEPGRDDGLLCSACHNEEEAAGGYGVEVARNQASLDLDPRDDVYGRTWVGPGGWAERFINNNTKPQNIKAALQAWIDGNYQP